MRTYTIESDRSVQFGPDGSVEIFGFEFGRMIPPTYARVPISAVVMVTGSSLLSYCTKDMLLSRIRSSFRTDPMLFSTLDGKAERIIFTVKTGGPVHNQRKFLRSVRGKLNGIQRDAEAEALQEELDYKLSQRLGQTSL